MIRNYIKIAIRNLLKQKFYAAINIFGLTLGLTSVTLIMLYVADELSFDRFHTKQAEIYRVVENQFYSGQPEFPVAVTPATLGPSLYENYPEVEDFCRLNYTSRTFRHNDLLFRERSGAFVDSSFFSMFDFKLKEGTPKDIFSGNTNIVLNETLAEKYFEDESPLNKTILINNEEFLVKGVMENFPQNSHFRLNYVIPFSKRLADSPGLDTLWNSNFLNTYVLLNPKSNVEQFNTSIVNHLRERVTYNVDIYLQPLADIHLSPVNYTADASIKGNKQYVTIFSMVAFFILIIACINFMNLSTARSAKRAKEVGLRKTVGARKPQLIFQFIAESIMVAFLSALISILLVDLLLPTFNNLSGKSLDLNLFQSLDSILIYAGALVAVSIVTGFLAGSYPAFFLSSFKPAGMLKSHASRGGAGGMRKILVVAQFVISIVLIVGTLVVQKQLNYISNKTLGFNKENVLYMPLRGELGNNYPVFKNELKQLPGVVDVTLANQDPSYIANSGSGYSWPGKNPEENMLFHSLVVGEDYLKTMGMTLAKGRAFLADVPADTAGMLINEEAVKVLGFEEPIGMEITNRRGTVFKVLGVVNDFHFKSVHEKIEPLFMFLNRDFPGMAFVRVSGDGISETITAIENSWKSFDDNAPFSYYFLDEDFQSLYAAEERTGKIFNTFAFLAIMISCLGLFGLSAYTAEQRTKEIGIRKILGASTGNLFYIISKDFTLLVGIAFVISLPVAWIWMENWLDSFAYRVSLAIDIFLIAGISSLLIALLTVSYQSLKTALNNPVNALRNE